MSDHPMPRPAQVRAHILQQGRKWYATYTYGPMNYDEIVHRARTRERIEHKAAKFIAKETARLGGESYTYTG